LATPAGGLQGSNVIVIAFSMSKEDECMRKYTSSSVKKGEKARKKALLIHRGFLREIGLFGKRISDFLRDVYGNGTKKRPN
jgi:hypothetical protein